MCLEISAMLAFAPFFIKQRGSLECFRVSYFSKSVCVFSVRSLSLSSSMSQKCPAACCSTHTHTNSCVTFPLTWPSDHILLPGILPCQKQLEQIKQLHRLNTRHFKSVLQKMLCDQERMTVIRVLMQDMLMGGVTLSYRIVPLGCHMLVH